MAAITTTWTAVGLAISFGLALWVMFGDPNHVERWF